MENSIVSKMLAMARVRIYKENPKQDDRKTLCGEPMKTDGTRVWFEVPAAYADDFVAVHRYIKGEEFILEPKEETKKKE